MTTVDRLFDTAMQIVMKFGPERRIAPIERLLRVFPDLDRTAASSLLLRCSEVEHFAYQLASDVHKDAISEETAAQQIFGLFPGLSLATARNAARQGLYFWWHDNG